MFNRLLGNSSSQEYEVKKGSVNIITALFPVLLLFFGFNLLGTNSKLKLNINIDDNVEKKINMLQEIIPYFTEKEQVILSKVNDILDIINKFSRIMKTDYKPQIKSLANNLAYDERMEKVLEGMTKYLEGDNKILAEKLLDTKYRINNTKVNINNYREQVAANKISNINSILELLKCFTPVLDEKNKKTINKMEKIMKVLNEN